MQDVRIEWIAHHLFSPEKVSGRGLESKTHVCKTVILSPLRAQNSLFTGQRRKRNQDCDSTNQASKSTWSRRRKLSRWCTYCRSILSFPAFYKKSRTISYFSSHFAPECLACFSPLPPPSPWQLTVRDYYLRASSQSSIHRCVHIWFKKKNSVLDCLQSNNGSPRHGLLPSTRSCSESSQQWSQVRLPGLF